MCRPKYPDIKRPEYEVCGTHVRTFADVLVIPLALIGVLGIVVAVLSQQYLYLISSVINLVVTLTVFAADKFENPSLYIVCMIWNGLSMFGGGFLIGLSLYALANDGGAVYAILIALCIAFMAYTLCLNYVVRRARIYMISEVRTGNVKRNYDRDCNQAADNA